MDKAHKRAFKNSLYEQFERIGKALSSGRRLELLDLLAQGTRTVEELAEEAEMSVANTSQHLQVLRSAGLVEVHRSGTYARYSLPEPSVFDLWRSLRIVAERRLADLDRIVHQFLEDRRSMESVTKAELIERVARDEVVVLDVRPAEEFEAGHIRGARNIPVDELADRLAEIPRGREIVAYCRGPYCVYADEAVKLLGERGFHARRLNEGFPEWRADGLPVE